MLAGHKNKGKERIHTTLGHANFIALAETASLAALAAILVDGALVGGGADVVRVPWRRDRGARETECLRTGQMQPPFNLFNSHF